MKENFTNAERQKRYRQRSNRRIRVVPVELSEEDILTLVKEGHLEEDDSDDPKRIAEAMRLKLMFHM